MSGFAVGLRLIYRGSKDKHLTNLVQSPNDTSGCLRWRQTKSLV